MSGGKQVFQSESPGRWKKFIWSLRIIIGSVLFITSVIAIDLFISPKAFNKNEIFKKIFNIKSSRQTVDIKYEARPAKPFTVNLDASPLNYHDLKMRAAFYVNWDRQAFVSLHENADKINTIIPEWFLLDESKPIVKTDVDMAALAVMQRHKMTILPMLTNFVNGESNKEIITKIIKSPLLRKTFINSLVYNIRKYKLHGININFQGLDEPTYFLLEQFQRELYAKFQENGYIVTSNINPLEMSYNQMQLQRFNDHVFVLAFGQHSEETLPGPIAEREWVDAAIRRVTKQIPQGKLVLVMSAYAVDWTRDGQVKNISVSSALNIARSKSADINYNKVNQNLDFNYKDEKKIVHQVYFTNASTNYYIAELAKTIGVQSLGIWRLGTEDKKLWKFFSKNSMAVTIRNEGINPEFENLNFLTLHKNKTKRLVLTFDDGPDGRYTPQILEILKREKVPAAFFVTGMSIENNIPLLKRVYEEGHEIGNHTFSHPNLLEVSDKRAELEMRATRRLIEGITGHSTTLYRPPFSTDKYSKEWVEIRKVEFGKHSYFRIESTVDSRDWEKDAQKDTIIKRVKRDLVNGNIILMHDGGGKREETVKALPVIIKYLKSQGYTFVSVAEYMGKTKSEIMPSLPASDYYLAYGNNFMAHAIYVIQRGMGPFFIMGIILAMGRTIFIAIVSLIQFRRSKKEKLNMTYRPLVSVIVPAYNEEITVIRTIENLLKSDYPNYEIIFVDDGSKDNTYQLVYDAFNGISNIKVLTKPNGGKAAALNFGIEQATGEFVVCIDADTILQTDALTELMKFVTDDKVGAVGGNVKVLNETSVLTKWQSIEYITAQNFDKRAFDLMNCISVIPGAIGLFRKSVFLEVGKFGTDTLAEDCDLTVRILRAGYVVRYSPDAKAWTEAPESLGQFMKQRSRWTFGIMQTFWKHKDAFLNKKYKALGLFVLPNVYIYQMILPLFLPLADILMITSFITGNGMIVVFYYFAFFAVEAGGAWLAFSFEKEDPKRIVLMLPQRIIYRYYMWWVLVMAYVKAIKGELQGWGILKRTGNASVPQVGGSGPLPETKAA